MPVKRLPYVLALLAVLTPTACNGPESTEPDPPVVADTAASRPAPPATEASGVPRIVVLGNSIAAGYGLDPAQAFPALLQQKIDSLGWAFEVENAGVSGETTAGGLSRLNWLLETPVAVLIVELGGNDGLRGLPLDATRRNLVQIIERTQQRYPDAQVLLAGMQMPPNLGEPYVSRFRDLFPDVAAETGAHLIPFVLEGVGGIARLNQSDGIHPTAEGQRLVANNVWAVLRPVLETQRAEAPATL